MKCQPILNHVFIGQMFLNKDRLKTPTESRTSEVPQPQSCPLKEKKKAIMHDFIFLYLIFIIMFVISMRFSTASKVVVFLSFRFVLDRNKSFIDMLPYFHIG